MVEKGAGKCRMRATLTVKKMLCSIPLILFLTTISVFASDKLPAGSKAPDFAFPCIGSDDPVTMSDFVNKKVILVHLWKSK